MANITTEKQARTLARRFPQAAHAGWLLACDAPENNAKGETMLKALDVANHRRARDYRDYCQRLYASVRTTG